MRAAEHPQKQNKKVLNMLVCCSDRKLTQITWLLELQTAQKWQERIVRTACPSSGSLQRRQQRNEWAERRWTPTKKWPATSHGSLWCRQGKERTLLSGNVGGTALFVNRYVLTIRTPVLVWYYDSFTCPDFYYFSRHPHRLFVYLELTLVDRCIFVATLNLLVLRPG